MAQGVFTPYSTVSGFVNVFPGWVPKEDQERIASYQTYEEIYWNQPETFKLVVRGTESKPIYIPSGRIIVETMYRYFGKNLNFQVNPLIGQASAQELANVAFTNLFRREKIKSKFNSMKRYGLIRGDMIFHVLADPTKAPGTRISIYSVDPGSYFPIYSDENLDRLIKVHLLDQFKNEQGKDMIRRLTYEKNPKGAGIYRSVIEMEQAEFAKADPKYLIVSPPTLLPAEITAIPVYHIKNFDEPGNPFGSSEMRGLERIMAAINQSISDEDIALALEGLGVYTTDQGGPLDEDGNETDWIIGPGRVIENAGDFKRVQGVGSVVPYKDHIGMLYGFMKEASGTPDAAIGKIDVQVAESGIALALQMGPIISRAEEKEDQAIDTIAQMFYDLKTWHKVYEQMDFLETDIMPTFGDRLPTNRKAEIDLHVAMVMCVPPIMSATTARERLAEKGITFAADEFARIVQEAQAMAEAAGPVDAEGDRMDQEVVDASETE